MRHVVIAVIGVALWVVGFIVSIVIGAGNQPWGETLSDNFMFARSLPFTLGLGVALGYARATWPQPAASVRAGSVRRFAGTTVWVHWLATLAVLVGLATGAWQYLKGLLDVSSPMPMAMVYRLHYIAASLLVLVIALMLTGWWMRGENALGVPKGGWIRTLRGLAHELPRPLGASLAYLLGLDLRRAAPPTEQFTPYEKAISFPTWVIALALITITGILKAMRYIYPIPGDILYWVSAIHVGAMVLLGLKVLDHFRYVIAPSRWGMMVAMATGWMSARYVQLKHPGWHVSDEAAPASTEAPAPVRPVGGPA